MKQKYKDNRQLQRLWAVIKLVTLVNLVFIIPLTILFSNPELKSSFSSIEEFHRFLNHYNQLSLLIYFVCQILQVIISVIPGQIIQIAGGYMFGFPKALLVSLSGVAIGTTISFYISRLLGKKSISILIGEKKFNKYNAILNSKKSYMILFIIYLFPGLPKDVLSYMAGVSNMRFLTFIIISLAGRLPSMTCSLLMGYFIIQKNYIGMIIVILIVISMILVFLINRKRLDQIFDQCYNKSEKKRTKI